MANFRTHLAVAATASGIVSIGLLQGGMASQYDVVLFFSLGTLGGILPDIDSDYSIPAKLLFITFALTFSFLAVFSKINQYSIAELLLLWSGIYLVVRYFLFKIFIKFTVHRGIFHSILAAFFFLCLTTIVTYNVFSKNDIVSWFAGFFVFFGYVVHLLLDEAYSVDILDSRIKKSFGSAMKIISFKYLTATTILAVLTAIAFYLTPQYDGFLQTVLDAKMYTSMKNHFLPTAGWFQ